MLHILLRFRKTAIYPGHAIPIVKPSEQLFSHALTYSISLCVQKRDAEMRRKNLEEAKSISIKEDSSLPTAKKVNQQFNIRPLH